MEVADEDAPQNRATETPRHIERETREPHPLSFLSLSELREILRVDPLKAANDLEYILRQKITFNAASKGQASYLLQRQEYDDWFTSRQPDLLVVDGNLTTTRDSKISPLSLVCAKLIKEGLSDRRPGVLLYFFCSENMSAKDGLSGPQRIMCSLLEQLLGSLDSRNCLSLNFIDSRWWQHGLERLDLGILCRTFRNLISQLPTTSVYCIIDGMSLYERELWKEDLLSLLEMFRELVRDHKLRQRVKVLITNPARMRYITSVVGEGSRITLRANDIDRRS